MTDHEAVHICCYVTCRTELVPLTEQRYCQYESSGFNNLPYKFEGLDELAGNLQLHSLFYLLENEQC